MANIVHGPDFLYARTVTLSDTEDNAVGACGIHNASINIGLVNIVFGDDDVSEAVTIGLDPNQYVFCRIRRVMATGTTHAEADLRILY